MKLFCAYLRAKRGALLSFALCAAVFALVLFLSRLPLLAVGYAALLCAVFLCARLGVGYARFRARAKRLQGVLAQGAQGLENLPEPADEIERRYQLLLRRLLDDSRARENRACQEQAERDAYYTAWTHQIKTPIAAMRLLLQAEEAPDPGELSDELFRIERYAEMALCYQRVETMGNDLLLEKRPLEPIVRQAARRYARAFIRKGLSLRVEAMPFCVLTDEKWLGFVVEQLLSNAVKYTREGGVHVYAPDGDTLVIEDTGAGIDAADVSRLGERGFTGRGGRADKSATGLGLWLCRRALDRLGHQMEFASRPGRGTRVTLRLGRSEIPVE